VKPSSLERGGETRTASRAPAVWRIERRLDARLRSDARALVITQSRSRTTRAAARIALAFFFLLAAERSRDARARGAKDVSRPPGLEVWRRFTSPCVSETETGFFVLKPIFSRFIATVRKCDRFIERRPDRLRLTLSSRASIPHARARRTRIRVARACTQKRQWRFPSPRLPASGSSGRCARPTVARWPGACFADLHSLHIHPQETLCHELLTPRRSKSPSGKPVVPRASCAPAPRSRSSGCPRAKSSECARRETRTALARTERARFPARVGKRRRFFDSAISDIGSSLSSAGLSSSTGLATGEDSNPNAARAVRRRIV
jgi:hypothetical protein